MKNRCKKYLKISFWTMTTINLIFFFIFLIVTLNNNNPSFFYGFLLCFLLPYTFLFLTFIKWRIFSLIKSKKKIVFSLIFSKIFVTLVFILLPIVGIQSNILQGNIIFNFWGMLAPIIISLLYLFLNQILIAFFHQSKYNPNNKVK